MKVRVVRKDEWEQGFSPMKDSEAVGVVAFMAEGIVWEMPVLKKETLDKFKVSREYEMNFK